MRCEIDALVALEQAHASGVADHHGQRRLAAHATAAACRVELTEDGIAGAIPDLDPGVLLEDHAYCYPPGGPGPHCRASLKRRLTFEVPGRWLRLRVRPCCRFCGGFCCGIDFRFWLASGFCTGTGLRFGGNLRR